MPKTKTPAAGTANKAAAAKYKVTLRTEPDPPKGAQENAFHVTVTDPAGKPVADAKVTVGLLMAAMPEMNMPAMKSSKSLTWTGSEYMGKGNIAMAGLWKVTIKVRKRSRVLAVYKTDMQAR
ncbi:MAG: FixH family protein [Terriglobales bacterium]